MNVLNNLWKRCSNSNLLEIQFIEAVNRNSYFKTSFFNQMLNSTIIAIERPIQTRIKRLTSEYTNCDPQLLIDSVKRISKRLGNDNAINAISKIETGIFEEAVEITLRYYDKTYLYGLNNKRKQPVVCNLINNDISQNCTLLIGKMKDLLK